MKKVLSIFCILTVMMLQVSCGNNSSSEEQTQSQVVEDTSNNVTSEEIPQEDEIVIDDEQTTEEDTSIEDENIKLGEIVDSGECGENATWKLDEYGTLVISGTGELYDFSYWFNSVKNEWVGEHSCPWNDYQDYIKSIYIEEGITAIYGNSFECMNNLTNVKLPNTLKEIKGEGNGASSYAFYKCPNLKSLELPNSINSLSSAFVDCGLTDIIIPDSVVTIGEEAFRDCKDLINIEIPNSVTTIGEFAFTGCSSLESIYIPDSVTLMGWESTFEGESRKIYSSAFYGCSNLQSVRLSNNITSIGYGTFFNCPKLNYLYIPDSVTRIEQAFVGCTGLETIVIPSSVTTIVDGTFAEKVDGLYLKGQLDVTIQGTINSYAQQYAEEHDFNFEVMSNPN